MKTGSKNRVSKNNGNTVSVYFKKKVKLPCDVEAAALRVLDSEAVKNFRLSIVFTDDKFIKMMNTEYRHKNRATDVITFENSGNSGDIYISVDMARKNAEQFGSLPDVEMARLITHGVLHALGYDHMNAKDEKVMEGRTRKYMSFFKV